MKLKIIKNIFLFLSFVLLSCSDRENSQPPYVPIEELLSSLDTVSIDGSKIWLSTSLWRDFMPISPPDGKPLAAIIFITTADSSQFPSAVSSDAVWIVNENQVWKSWFTYGLVPPDLQKPYNIVEFASNGPKWGPGIYVTVIVRVYSSQEKKSYFLRASNQWISRTD